MGDVTEKPPGQFNFVSVFYLPIINVIPGQLKWLKLYKFFIIITNIILILYYTNIY